MEFVQTFLFIGLMVSAVVGQRYLYESPKPFYPNNGEYLDSYSYSYLDGDLTCEQRDACVNRDVIIQEQFINPEDVNTFNCFCDDMCQIYGDCCFDFVKTPENQKYESYKLRRNAFTCARMDGLDTENPVYVVDTCPKNYGDAQVKNACEGRPQRDIFSAIPVSGEVSGILYKNYYCSLCNAEFNHTFWNVDIECKNLPPDVDTVSRDFRLEEILHQLLMARDNGCTLLYKHNTHKARPCKENVVFNCHDAWTDKIVKRKCRSGRPTAYRYAIQRIFRNEFCAKCQFLNSTQVECKDDVTPTKGPGLGRPPGDLPPFSVLLDMNLGSGDVKQRVGLVSTEYTETRVQLRQCRVNQVYDPFSRICRTVYCEPGQVFHEGICQADDNSRNKPTAKMTTQSTLSSFASVVHSVNHTSGDIHSPEHDVATPPINTVKRATAPDDVYIGIVQLNCPVVILKPEYFQMADSDGTVYVPSYNKYFTVNEYKNASTGEIIICTPFLERNYTETTNVTHHIEMFKFDRIQGLLSYIGLLISIICLFVVFVIYMIFPELRNTAGKCIVCLVVCLILAQLTFMLGGPLREFPIACVILAVLLHFFLLCAFCWMNVLSLDIFTIISSKTTRTDTDSSCFIYYSLYAWITPLIIVGVALIIEFLGGKIPDFQPMYGDGLCWITQRWPLLITFAAPVALILVANITIYIITVVKLCLLTRAARYLQADRKQKTNFLLYVKLCFIMGLTWLFGFVAAITDLQYLWYVFIVFNTLQGAFICFAFVCTRKVFRLLSGKDKKTATKGARQLNSNSNSNRGVISSSWNTTKNTLLDTSYNGDAKVIESRETSI